MQEIKKPALTPQMRNRLNDLYLLLQECSRTKKELINILGCGERQVRELISIIAQKVPVISTSDKVGYSIAGTGDFEAVEHQLNENNSRIAEISKRNQPLIDFLKLRELK